MVKEFKNAKLPPFDANAFLASAGVAKRVAQFRKSQKIYSQGDPAGNVLYIQAGEIKLSVVNGVGKEAVVALLGPGDFLEKGVSRANRFASGWPLRLRPSL
jgi:CRP-like cAMP-binding protein